MNRMERSAKMGSSSPQEWLELSLGLRGTKKKQQKVDEKKLCQKKVCATISHEHLEGYDEEGEGDLDLKLQIGPRKSYNMGIMDLMHHQKKKSKWAFHRDYSISNFGHFHGLSSSVTPNSAGLWFSLLSAPNRKGGAALPQIPKAYIRVKDEKMTVLMVKKYLITKLGLSNEAQVELWCMGERLLHTQSLKEVRDGVWLPKLVEFVNSNSSLSTSSSIFHHCSHHHQTPSSSTYLMPLHYGRTCLF